jgi:hypothetical protein
VRSRVHQDQFVTGARHAGGRTVVRGLGKREGREGERDPKQNRFDPTDHVGLLVLATLTVPRPWPLSDVGRRCGLLFHGGLGFVSLWLTAVVGLLPCGHDVSPLAQDAPEKTVSETNQGRVVLM